MSTQKFPTDEQVVARLSANLKKLLLKKDLTPRQLVLRMNCPQVSVYRAVNGQGVPGIGLITRIALALDVTVEELIESKKKF